MFQPLPTAQEMAAWDQMAISEFGLLPELLMENASREAFHVLKEQSGDPAGKNTVIFAGPGNNGGDAFGLARHLINAGSNVLVLNAQPKSKYLGATAYHLDLAQKVGAPLVHLKRYNLDFLPQPDIVVDGLLGTGFRGELSPEFQTWIVKINDLGRKAFVLALDIPSGLNSTSGRPCPIAVRAQATVTFEQAKLGPWLGSAREFTGRLYIQSIGIPRCVILDHPPAHFGLTNDVLDAFPISPLNVHKGDAGHLLILGGSTGLSGAPNLAALAALRSGSGLVTIGCPKSLSLEIKSTLPDVMTMPLGQGEEWDERNLSLLRQELHRFDAVIIGPGLGRSESSGRFFHGYAENPHPRSVYDADALYWLAQEPELIAACGPEAVFTPHPGEMAKLHKTSTSNVQADRTGVARHFSQTHRCLLVLKGANTVIAAPDQPVFLSPFAEPNLAVGGSGDILAGIIGSLLARGLSPLDAASLGVYWHGFCGARLKDNFPYRGNLAQDIANHLPHVLKELIDAHRQRHHDH